MRCAGPFGRFRGGGGHGPVQAPQMLAYPARDAAVAEASDSWRTELGVVLVCAGLLLNKATVGQDVITEDDSRALSRRAT